MEAFQLRNDPVDDTSKFGVIDWKLLATEVFKNSKVLVEEKRDQVCKTLFEGCDNQLIYAVTKWQGWFRKMIIVAGAAHSHKVATDLGAPYHEMIPEVMETTFFSNFPDQKLLIALGLVMHNGFYTKVLNSCE